MASAVQPSPQSPQNQPTFVEEPVIYPFTFTLAANQHISQVPVPIARDADFMLTGLAGAGHSTGRYTLNFQLPSQRFVANSEVYDADILGTGNQPTAVGPPPVYRAGSSGPQVSLTDVSGANNTVNILFCGVRRIRTT